VDDWPLAMITTSTVTVPVQLTLPQPTALVCDFDPALNALRQLAHQVLLGFGDHGVLFNHHRYPLAFRRKPISYLHGCNHCLNGI
jgi:hypothetical protein